MSLSVISAIAAHKLAAALILGSLAISGGALAASPNINHQANSVGEMSFTINPSFNVTTLASLDLGTLSTGQTGTVSSSSTINFTSTGNYSLSLVDIGFLHSVFSSFNVTVTGLGTQDNLSFSQPTQMVNISSTGIYTAHVTLTYTVRDTNVFAHGITVTNAPFLQLFSGQVPPGLHNHWHDDNASQQDDNNDTD